MSPRGIVIAIVAALAVLYAAWFLATHDRVITQQWVAPSGEARLRDFLAAERFAERMGMNVMEVRSLPDLDTLPAHAVLVLPNQRRELHPGKVEDLGRWVERGGHLIVEAEPLGVADALLDKLGVTRSRAELLDKPFTVELRREARKLNVSFLDAMTLETSGRDVRLRAGGRLVSLGRGDGLVTAATSLRFARNPSYDDYFAKLQKAPPRSIAGLDHAELFWRVLSLKPAHELLVYFRPERLSLWGFLVQNAAPALAAGGLLLALWLWSIIPRFGPIAPDPPPGRRRLLDHLRASGRYYWAKGLRSRLVVAARDAALRRLARAQPDFATASESERVARLARVAAIPKEEAARFLSAAGAMRGGDFIRLAQQAQRVHSALEKGAK